jgi:hypothetical protein
VPPYNALDLITRSLRETGYLSGSATPNASDGQQGFETLNGFIDTMKIDPDFIYCHDFNLYALTSGVQSYAIGPTAPAPFTTVRPSCIVNANIVDANNVRVSHLAIINDDQKMAITVPNIPSSLPGAIHYKRGMANGTLTLYAKPGSGYRVELETWVDLPEFPDLTTDANFPPGYYELLVYGLAQKFCTRGWGNDRDPEIDRQYERAKQTVLALNLSPTPLLATRPQAVGVRSQSGLGVSEYFIDGDYIKTLYR